MLDVATKTWTQVGSLNQSRFAHAVVVRSNDFVIMGGRYTKSTERCVLQNEKQMLCASVEPELTDFAYYAEAMIVEEDFCMPSISTTTGTSTSTSRLNALFVPLILVQAVFL